MKNILSTVSLLIIFLVSGPLQGMSSFSSSVPIDSLREKSTPVPQRAEDISPLLTGEKVPDVTLPDVSGQPVRLHGLIAQQPTILVFYRGGWCPYCSLQLSGLQEIEGDLREMGYRITAISTDSPENLEKSLEKQKLTYTLLSDADLNAAKQFGLAYKSPASYDRFLPETSGGKNTERLIPVPSVFFTNREGVILFEYISPNIRQRISADLLKAVAGALKTEW